MLPIWKRDDLAPRSTAAQWSHLGINHSLALRRDGTQCPEPSSDLGSSCRRHSGWLSWKTPNLPCLVQIIPRQGCLIHPLLKHLEAYVLKCNTVIICNFLFFFFSGHNCGKDPGPALRKSSLLCEGHTGTHLTMEK